MLYGPWRIVINSLVPMLLMERPGKCYPNHETAVGCDLGGIRPEILHIRILM